MTVTNTGQGTITNLDVADDKQPQLGSFHVDSLAPGKSASHEYAITVDKSVNGTVVNTACATADTPSDSQVPPTINCDPAGFEVANYTTVKTADPAPGSKVYPGGTVKYTVTVTQQGTAEANASFSDDLADVLDDASYNGDVKASLGTAKFAAGHLVWSGTIPVGGAATVTYSVTVKRVKNLQKDGSFGLKNVVSSDGCQVVKGQTVNCDTEHRVGRFDLKIVKKVVGSHSVLVGHRVRYLLQVSNLGPDASTAPITVTDKMPKGLDLLRAHGKGWRCTVHKRTDQLSCTRAVALPAHHQAGRLIVIAKTNKAALHRHRLINVAKVSARGDMVPPNNRHTAAIRVHHAPPRLPDTGYRTIPPVTRWLV